MSPCQLSPLDTALLDSLYLFHNFNYRTFAMEHKLSSRDLLAWTRRTDIREEIDALKTLQRESLEAAHTEARLSSIRALKEVADTATDPVERRRAASVLMRKLDSIPAAAPLAPQGPLEPDDEDADAAADRIVKAILESRCPEDLLERLHPHLAPDATIDDQPAPEDSEDLITDHADGATATFQRDISRAKDHTRSSFDGTTGNRCYQLTLKTDDAKLPTLWFWLDHQPQGPRAGQWLIRSLERDDIRPDSS